MYSVLTEYSVEPPGEWELDLGKGQEMGLTGKEQSRSSGRGLDATLTVASLETMVGKICGFTLVPLL